jgi:hypothetical protein
MTLQKFKDIKLRLQKIFIENPLCETTARDAFSLKTYIRW